MRISDWSSDVCSSDLHRIRRRLVRRLLLSRLRDVDVRQLSQPPSAQRPLSGLLGRAARLVEASRRPGRSLERRQEPRSASRSASAAPEPPRPTRSPQSAREVERARSEEHTSELQSLMRISYAVFCLKKKTNNKPTQIEEKRK